MNLESTLSICSGGPGSGRHKEFDNLLQPKGFTRAFRRSKAFLDNTGGLKTVYSKPDPRPGYLKGEQQIRVADNGDWEHVSNTSHVIKEGNGASSLKDHLSQFEKER